MLLSSELLPRFLIEISGSASDSLGKLMSIRVTSEYFRESDYDNIIITLAWLRAKEEGWKIK